MAYALRDINENIVSISSFARGQASKHLLKAKKNPVVVCKNNVPEVVIVDVAEYAKLEQAYEDNELLELALERIMDGALGEEGKSEGEVMGMLGISEEDLEATEDPEID